MNHRLAAIVPAYLVVFTVCLYSALLLRFEFEIPGLYRDTVGAKKTVDYSGSHGIPSR